MSITQIKLNNQVFLVFGTKLSNDRYNANKVYDNAKNDVTNVIDAFGLWEQVENLTLEQILKNEKVQK